MSEIGILLTEQEYLEKMKLRLNEDIKQLEREKFSLEKGLAIERGKIVDFLSEINPEYKEVITRLLIDYGYYGLHNLDGIGYYDGCQRYPLLEMAVKNTMKREKDKLQEEILSFEKEKILIRYVLPIIAGIVTFVTLKLINL